MIDLENAERRGYNLHYRLYLTFANAMNRPFLLFAVCVGCLWVAPLQAEELPPPKLDTPHYLEARQTLLEHLYPQYHAPALRVWHRMIDFTVESGGNAFAFSNEQLVQHDLHSSI